MNSLVIKTKLESLRRCLDRIESKKPITLEGLLQDIDTQDILALNIERSVQLCVDIANHILSSLKNLIKILDELLASEIYQFMHMTKSIGNLS
jgi:hypothetical protein